jgi:hypothetical protein
MYCFLTFCSQFEYEFSQITDLRVNFSPTRVLLINPPLNFTHFLALLFQKSKLIPIRVLHLFHFIWAEEYIACIVLSFFPSSQSSNHLSFIHPFCYYSKLSPLLALASPLSLAQARLCSHCREISYISTHCSRYLSFNFFDELPPFPLLLSSLLTLMLCCISQLVRCASKSNIFNCDMQQASIYFDVYFRPISS